MVDFPFFGVYFFERLYPKDVCCNCWLTWVTCHSSQNNFSKELILKIYVLSKLVDLVDLSILANLFLDRFDFWKYVCCRQWLTWVTCHSSQNNFRKESILKIYVSSKLVDLVDLSILAKLFLERFNFWKYLCVNQWLTLVIRYNFILTTPTFHFLLYIFWELYPKHVSCNCCLTLVTQHSSHNIFSK